MVVLNGKGLKRLRTERGYKTQSEFAKAIGINTGRVSLMENNAKISADNAIKMSRFYNLPLGKFYDGGDEL